jgi:hypothetical protein
MSNTSENVYAGGPGRVGNPRGQAATYYSNPRAGGGSMDITAINKRTGMSGNQWLGGGVSKDYIAGAYNSKPPIDQ